VAIYANYVAVLERLGLAPVLVTPVHSPASIAALLARCTGLVLSGGEDVDPTRFGEAPIPELGQVNPQRDATEFTALAAALERELPVLGICRGCQLLNVHFGGSLYQDLAVQFPGVLVHEQKEPWGGRSHHARVEPGTRLAAIVPGPDLFINSFHHQAIRRLAPGLVTSAVADDGVVEAVEARDHEWVIGVQWHPERHEAHAPEADPDRLLFHAFAGAVRRRGAR
jgi:putative glutamine amidotransferase